MSGRDKEKEKEREKGREKEKEKTREKEREKEREKSQREREKEERERAKGQRLKEKQKQRRSKSRGGTGGLAGAKISLLRTRRKASAQCTCAAEASACACTCTCACTCERQASEQESPPFGGGGGGGGGGGAPALGTLLVAGRTVSLYRLAEHPHHCVARLAERGLAEALEAWQGLAAVCTLAHPRLVAYHEAWVEGDEGVVFASTSAASPRRADADGGQLPRSGSADELSESVNSSITAITFTDYNMTDSDEEAASGDEQALEGEFGFDAFAHEQARATVCVRMDLLGPPSLADFLSSRTAVDVVESMAIFRAVAEGLAHLHAAGIVHGRLRPRHIYLSESSEGRGVRLVGMALAAAGAPVPRAATPTGARPQEATEVAQLYRCPVAAARTEGDMYALGLLAVELFHPAHWEARAAALEEARRRVLPRALLTRLPTLAATALWLLAPAAADRPSAAELLQSGLFAAPPAAPTVVVPRAELESLDKRIHQQEHTISRQESIIRAQELRIQALSEEVKRRPPP